MGESGEDDEKGMVSDVEGVWSLGGTEISSSMRDGVCACVAVVVVAVVVVVVALMVAVGVVGLMVALGVVVLVIVVRVFCIGAVEVDCTEVVDIFVLGGVFVDRHGG